MPKRSFTQSSRKKPKKGRENRRRGCKKLSPKKKEKRKQRPRRTAVGYGTFSRKDHMPNTQQLARRLQPDLPTPRWGLHPRARDWEDPDPWTHGPWRYWFRNFPKISDKKCVTVLLSGDDAVTAHRKDRRQFRAKKRRGKIWS